MTSVGECLQYSTGGTSHDGGIVVHVSQVVHVTFYITEHPSRKGWYKLFEASEKRGIHDLWSEDDGVSVSNAYHSYEDATNALAKAQVKLEELLERKRDGIPTQKQLYFLFLHKIPIPPDLTWGQASDLIDEQIVKEVKERQTKRLERFNGLAEGDRVSLPYGVDKKTGIEYMLWRKGQSEEPKFRDRYNITTKIGYITKLTQAGKRKYVYIKFDDSTLRTEFFDTIQKIAEEATT